MAQTSSPKLVLAKAALAVRQQAPALGIEPDYFDGWLARNKDTLLGFLERQLAGAPDDLGDLPEEWTKARRTAANLAAMKVAAAKSPEQMTTDDRRTLAQYSGWGGLDPEAVADQFPAGFPVPEERGLIHEFYTPTKVTDEVARVVKPLLPDLATARDPKGKIVSLEPSAGIGRFLRSFSKPDKAFSPLEWVVVEYSALSARMLQAIRPDLSLFVGPFERWVADYGPDYEGKLDFVVANPPYGQRGAAFVEDPDKEYRRFGGKKESWIYFLRRGLDLLAPGGLGVYLIPGGFITGTGRDMTDLRESVLRQNHLSTAYRLPSKLFPGANLVVDLLFFRRRQGTLEKVAEDDLRILQGDYFEDYPQHVLGDEVKGTGRWGHEVRGTFDSLPDLIERPLCTRCVYKAVEEPKKTGKRKAARRGMAREKIAVEADLPTAVSQAVALGLRVDQYMAALSSGDTHAAWTMWNELHADLGAWVSAHGNPRVHKELAEQVEAQETGAERFLTAFTKTGSLIPALRDEPRAEIKVTVQPNDVVGQATALYRGMRGGLTVDGLLRFHVDHGGKLSKAEALDALLSADWCLDGGRWDLLVPATDYYSGSLWPKYDRAAARAHEGDRQAGIQAEKIKETIGAPLFDDIGDISPQDGWVPLSLIAEWAEATLRPSWYAAHHGDEAPLALERKDGLLTVRGVDYEKIGVHGSKGAPSYITEFLGWVNHDRSLFKPGKRGWEEIDDARVRQAKGWRASFRQWLREDEDRKLTIERSYARHVLGYVAPIHSAEPLEVSRWNYGPKTTPHPWQNAGARRVLANRGGLIAFDVGVGKTLTGALVVARARQEGWARRPVILVPNTIVWKWHADLRTALPDYRIGVIGSKRKTIKKTGKVRSSTDTPEERAAKWTAFQAGEFDVMLMTYSALGRSRVDARLVEEYALSLASVQREIKLRQRNAKKAADSDKGMTVRQDAIVNEGVAAFVAEKLEMPASWRYDPGVAWNDLGIDLLLIDEAHNFKNLHMPAPREHGIPRFMGGGGSGSKRAWQLDFRSAIVRNNQGGAGIVELTATPAKNSPLEIYNLIKYLDPMAWERMGIRDPEAFIDRFLVIEKRRVVNASLEIVEASAVVGFKNLDELRDVLFRYGEFLTVEEINAEAAERGDPPYLVLPTPQTQFIEVDMDARQETAYDAVAEETKKAIESEGKRGAEALVMLTKMSLIAIHPDLAEGYKWKEAKEVLVNGTVDPHSPKFDRCADAIVADHTCGHIVFVENVAAHWWFRQVLIDKGMPAKRIAMLNAKTGGPADRTRIASQFNGNPEEGVKPKYDVVIANSVAYEGIDLQTRTCAIHNLDLPWEPATIHQRSGRGYRQGNTLESIEINYYFARRSSDGLRYDLITGKRGWLVKLIKSQDRETNNPGATLDLGPEELLLLVSRDPEKTQEMLDAVREKRAAEEAARLAKRAARTLRKVNGRLRRAEVTRDATDAEILRSDAEALIQVLANVDPDAWPWAKPAMKVRETNIHVTQTGVPIFSGFRVDARIPHYSSNPDEASPVEFGEEVDGYIGYRRNGEASWEKKALADLDTWAFVPLEGDGWPDDAAAVEEALSAMIPRLSLSYRSWSEFGWQYALPAWVERWWPKAEAKVQETLAAKTGAFGRPPSQKVPVLREDRVELVSGKPVADGVLLPPTPGGWDRFVQAFGKTGESQRAEADSVADYWWGRKLPSKRARGTKVPVRKKE